MDLKQIGLEGMQSIRHRSGGHLWIQYWSLGFNTRQRILWLAYQLSSFQQWTCSMQTTWQARHSFNFMSSPTYGVALSQYLKSLVHDFRCICETAKRDCKLGHVTSICSSVHLPARHIHLFVCPPACTEYLNFYSMDCQFFIFGYFFSICNENSSSIKIW